MHARSLHRLGNRLDHADGEAVVRRIESLVLKTALPDRVTRTDACGSPSWLGAYAPPKAGYIDADPLYYASADRACRPGADHTFLEVSIWLFRERLIRAGAIETLFDRFDQACGGGGQIVDASLVAAPKQRNTDAEKAEIKAGCIPQSWSDNPARLRQKDRDARWTVKFSKAKPRAEVKS